MTVSFNPKSPAESIYYGIDFAPLLGPFETITSANVQIRANQGTDESAPIMLSGAPLITGHVVRQLITGGIAGVAYLFSVTAVTSAGQVFVESAPLRVLEKA